MARMEMNRTREDIRTWIRESNPSLKYRCEELLPAEPPWTYAHAVRGEFAYRPPHKVLQTQDLIMINTQYKALISYMEVRRELFRRFEETAGIKEFVMSGYSTDKNYLPEMPLTRLIDTFRFVTEQMMMMFTDRNRASYGALYAHWQDLFQYFNFHRIGTKSHEYYTRGDSFDKILLGMRLFFYNMTYPKEDLVYSLWQFKNGCREGSKLPAAIDLVLSHRDRILSIEPSLFEFDKHQPFVTQVLDSERVWIQPNTWT